MRKKKKTLEQYKELGAKFRLFETMVDELKMEAGLFLTVKETGKFFDELDKVQDAIYNGASQIEAKMFRDYPELSDEYLRVFHGTIYYEASDEVDIDVVSRAKKFCRSLLIKCIRKRR